MTELNGLLDDASLPQRTVPVCLRMDLVARFEQLEKELADTALETSNVDSMAPAGVDRRREIAEELVQLTEQMRASTVVFTFEAMPRRAFKKLVDAHVPRDEVPADQNTGFNNDTIWEPLIRASLIDPKVTDEQWEKLDGKLSFAQFDKLATAAFHVNTRGPDVPFSHAASLLLRSSATK